ncbi:MAG: cobalamin B12-binding domain-containing protein [Acidobacteria bacterium]|nr:cobalamin B12-binding domain-containing protein [Acidobacteriota bacterium]
MPTGMYKMGTISKRTGFSPMLLRAWERRHGLLEPERGSGGHRLYTEDDLQVLYRVKELIDSGRSIGEIALIGRETLLAQGVAPGISRAVPDMANGTTTEGATESSLVFDPELESSGRSLIQAAIELDRARLDRTLDEAFARFAPNAVLHNLIMPSAHEIGRLWMCGELNVANEHMASDAFIHRVAKLLESASMGLQQAPSVLCGCFPDENHHLGALILAYELTRNGVRVDYISGPLPFEDLEQAIEVRRPKVTLLSVTRTALFHIHRPALIEAVRRRRSETKFLIGGQGAPDVDPALTELGVELWGSRLEIEKLKHTLRL